MKSIEVLNLVQIHRLLYFLALMYILHKSLQKRNLGVFFGSCFAHSYDVCKTG